MSRLGGLFSAPSSVPEGTWSYVSRRERIAALAQAFRLVIASLEAAIALVGFVLVLVGFARGLSPWALTAGAAIPGGLLGAAVRDLRRLSKPDVNRHGHRKRDAGPSTDPTEGEPARREGLAL
jgi:hypothetical protein